MKAVSLHSIQSALAAVLVGGVAALLWVAELMAVASVRGESRALLRKCIEDESIAHQAAARIGYGTRHAPAIEALAAQVEASLLRRDLTPAQLEPLEEARLTVVRSGAADAVAAGGSPGERSTFDCAGEQAEFHRLMPALAAWESRMILLQWQRFHLELPAGRPPLGNEATKLSVRGTFTLPKAQP